MLNWQDLDLNQPLNPAHPLNRGRLAWWLTIPQRYGPPTWWDLVAGKPATFSGFSSGNGWNTASNPGGAGSMKFNAGGKLTAAVNVQPSLTFACWVQLLAGQGSYGTIFAFSGNLGWFLLSTGHLNFYPEAVSSTSLTAGVWYHVAVTIDSSGNGKYYINGLQDATTFTYANTARTWQYFGNDGAGDTYLGYLNDFSAWNRALSASEISALYCLSQGGYPSVLNRRAYSIITPSTVVAVPAWGWQTSEREQTVGGCIMVPY